MTSLHSLVRAAVWLALSTAASLAHASDRAIALPNPADADVVVPATRYQSILAYRVAATGTMSPAQNWKALNQEVGSYNSMALTVDGEPEPQAAAVTQAPRSTKPAAPTQPPGMAAMHEQHAGHVQPAAAASDPHANHKKKEAR